MRREKTYLLDEIKGKIESSKALIVAKYGNVTPHEAWDFRSNLRENNADLEVVKKRIFLKALESLGYKYSLDELEGHIAVIFVKDESVNAIKTIFNFQKNTEKLEVLKGEIEGKSYGKDEMIMLSKLPSLNELRAEFLGLLEAPMAQVLSVMESLLTSVIYVIDEKKKIENKGE
ncbi:MAG: 50S ribosomal protein L10 [Parachlamydiales bacterium]|nr:50S ribosomal protein L10 [Parachlamydiales bacterium]